VSLDYYFVNTSGGDINASYVFRIAGPGGAPILPARVQISTLSEEHRQALVSASRQIHRRRSLLTRWRRKIIDEVTGKRLERPVHAILAS